MAHDEHEVAAPAPLADLARLGEAAIPSAVRDQATLGAPGGRFVDRVFGSPEFFHLWLAQAVSSLGDWLGFLAILILASRLGASAPGASVGLVMAARIIPGFFLSAGAGVIVDRLDRRQVMVVTMAVRAMVVATLPFVNSVLGLVFASLVLELATLFFSPAKEALVPNVVPAGKLTQANSLGLAAAYGTFPLGAGLFAVLAQVAEWLGSIDALDALRTSQEAVAFYANVVCYVISAVIIYRLDVPPTHVDAAQARRDEGEEEAANLGQVFSEIKEGWHYAFINPVVRSVNIGLACGLIGGGMLVPLGQTFSEEVLGAGPSGYGVFVFALGLGVAGGVIGVSTLQRRLPKVRTFVVSCWGAGAALLLGVSMSSLLPAAICVAVMGVFAGSVYVLGFTLLHENVEDELRGRIFSALYTLVRLCVLLSMALAPILADVFDGLSSSLVDRRIDVGIEIAVPGVRITLWLAGAIMLLAGSLAALSLRSLPEGQEEGV
ncbi:MAG TPA: MFS transporter [Acidimicrobiales bacterium]|nr:MFS transporter [Acidimicrobiales bacterium]